MQLPPNIIETITGPFQERPFLLLLVISLAPLLLGWRAHAFPRGRLLVMFLIPVLMTFILPFIPAQILNNTPGQLSDPQPLDRIFLLWPQLFSQWHLIILLGDMVVIIVAAGDLFLLPQGKAFKGERKALRIASLGKGHTIDLVIENHSRRTFAMKVRDDLPEQFVATPGEFDLTLAGDSQAELHYELTANRRGAFNLESIYLCIFSGLGLWSRYVTLPVKTELHVYPDMKQLSEYAILARTDRLNLLGVRRTRRVGQDNEFERLRDYTRDDNPRFIDWRATARRNTLTVKDFQTNQNQRLIFMVDCGRMMTGESGGLSLLDHSLNAALMLSYIALSKGDSVGMVCFSDRVLKYVPARSGSRHMNSLLHAGFDCHPEMVESWYDGAFTHLSRNERKRSLVILITNVIDEVNSGMIEGHLGRLAGRHLPLGLLLRDHALFDPAANPNPSPDQLYTAAAAADILLWRQRVLNRLVQRGVLTLDVFPEGMTAPLINRYLEIKARHLL